MSNTPTVRKIIDIDATLEAMRERLAVFDAGIGLTGNRIPMVLDAVLADHRRSLDTLEATVAEMRRILDQVEPASKDVPDMRGAEWALKCVRGEMRSALRGE